MVTNSILIFTCQLLVQDWPMEPLIAVAVYQIHQSVKRLETVDLLTLTEETLNGKLQFLCSVVGQFYQHLRLVKSAIKQLQAVRIRLHEDYNCFNLHREILRRLHQLLQDNEQKEKR